MKQVTTGLFNLPGLTFDNEEVSDELYEEMVQWTEETNCGMMMTRKLVSFKDEGHRDFFILRWTDALNNNSQ